MIKEKKDEFEKRIKDINTLNDDQKQVIWNNYVKEMERLEKVLYEEKMR